MRWYLVCFVCFVLTHVVYVNGKTRLHKLEELRLLAVRGQILTKLGLTSPPHERTNIEPAREELEAYQAVVNENDKKHWQELADCSGHLASNGYFGKRVVRLPLVTRTGQIIQFVDPKTQKTWIADINTFTFDKTQLNGETHIDRAELVLIAELYPTIPLTGAALEICSTKAEKQLNNSLHKECSEVLDSRFVTSQKEWDAFDITNFIKGLVTMQESTVVIRAVFKVLDQNNEAHRKSKITAPLPPYVLVWYVPTDRYEIEKRRRHRRALDTNFCRKRPKEKRCCLRPLYIDFQRDLKWNWIHAPPGFHANYCKGECPFLWSMDNQTHHTSIMALFNSLNPDAPSKPCCVARAYKPLVILYYDKGRPKIEELSNMVVTSCTCL